MKVTFPAACIVIHTTVMSRKPLKLFLYAWGCVWHHDRRRSDNFSMKLTNKPPLSLVTRFFLLISFFSTVMDDSIQHPLVATPPPRGGIDSPDRTSASAHGIGGDNSAFSSSPSTAGASAYKFDPNTSTGSFKGRSKSLAWTSSGSLPRLPVDYQFGDAYEPRQSTSVPYKARSWEPTLERAIKAIVSIKASHVRSFDTETSGMLYLCSTFYTLMHYFV